MYVCLVRYYKNAYEKKIITLLSCVKTGIVLSKKKHFKGKVHKNVVFLETFGQKLPQNLLIKTTGPSEFCVIVTLIFIYLIKHIFFKKKKNRKKYIKKLIKFLWKKMDEVKVN